MAKIMLFDRLTFLGNVLKQCRILWTIRPTLVPFSQKLIVRRVSRSAGRMDQKALYALISFIY